MKKVFCVISHTHWDREWYLPFEHFRLKLVDLIDRLIETIEEYPEYIFHLDAQTVVLEDYLEIRPWMKDTLKKYVSSGNIMVGPWYLQNDFYLTDGESTIRNLLTGHRIAKEFGRVDSIGYAPDQFGNISQLPQILNNFGIDSYVFGRGYLVFERNADGKAVRKNTPAEFNWIGADGSKLLAVNLRNWYNNAQNIPKGVENTKILTDIIERDFDGLVLTEYYLLMNGVDHLQAQHDLLPIIDEYNKVYGDRAVLKQYRISDYIKNVTASIEKNHVKLQEHHGELRVGPPYHILPGTLSSRHYLKALNCRMQNRLSGELEPLYSMLELNGCKGSYVYDQLNFAWKKLMHNHPHDSICGCSRDEVHNHMEDNYARIDEMTSVLKQRAVKELCYHSDIRNKQSQAPYYIGLINTTETEKNEITEVELNFLCEDNIKDFDIADFNGNSVDFAIKSKETVKYDIHTALNVPWTVNADQYKVYIKTNSVSPYSLKGLAVLPGKKPAAALCNTNKPILENKYVRVTVSQDGKVDLYVKHTDKLYKNILLIEETADIGDTYKYYQTDDPAVYSTNFKPEIKVIENNEFMGKISILWNMKLPSKYILKEMRRSKQSSIVPVKLIFSLSAEDKLLHIDYEINNTCCDHRIRLILKSDCIAESCVADIPFDIINHNQTKHDLALDTQTFPNTSFVAMNYGNHGLALFTEGAHEADHFEKNSVAVTLVRSVGVIVKDAPETANRYGKGWLCPGAQCLRKICGRLAVMGYEGNHITADLPNISLSLRNPIISYSFAADKKKFEGGKNCARDPHFQPFFYLPDYYPNALLGDNKSSFVVKGKTVCMSALKRAENKEGIIARFYNYSDNCDTVNIAVNGKIYRTNIAESEFSELGTDSVIIPVKPKEIVTLYIENE